VRVRDGTIFENTQKRKREMKKRKEKKRKERIIKQVGKWGEKRQTDKEKERDWVEREREGLDIFLYRAPSECVRGSQSSFRFVWIVKTAYFNYIWLSYRRKRSFISLVTNNVNVRSVI